MHHQWLYGANALKRCYRLVQIFQAVENRIPIEQELLSAQHLDEQSWNDEQEGHEEKALIPFPMITTCLILGASFDPTDGYLHGVDIEPFGMEFNEGDNNNGITVIDISELHHVRYCFADILPWGMESQTRVPLMTPLSASTYLWSYYDQNKKEDQEMFGKFIDRLEEWDLVDVAALRDTWPKGTWRDPNEVEDSGDEEDSREQTEFGDEEKSGKEEQHGEEEGSEELAEAGRYCLPIRQTKLAPDPSTVPNDREEHPTSNLTTSTIDTAENLSDQVAKNPAAGSVTLRGSAMNTMLEVALTQSESDSRLWMPQAELLVDFLPSLRRKLYEDPTALKTSPAGLYLMCKVLEGEHHVDLTPLKTFAIKDIEMVVSKLRENNIMESIALSNMPDLRVEHLEMIFVGETGLRGLYLLETPLITIDATVTFVNKHAVSLQDLYHTELLRRPLKLGLKRWQREDKIIFSANFVNQMIWVKTDTALLNEDGMRFDNGHIDWQKLLEKEKANNRWTQKLSCGVFPLDDILLPPVKFVTGLATFLNFASKYTSPMEGVHGYGIGAANSFAMAKSSIQGSDYQVGPLPSAVYASRTKSFPRSWPWVTTELTPGKWAVVVLDEGVTSPDETHPDVRAKLKYAMVTTRDSSSEDLIVADMSSFFAQATKASNQAELDVQGLNTYWTEQCKSIIPENCAIELCDEAEVRDLLQKVFSKTNHDPGRRDPFRSSYDSD